MSQTNFTHRPAAPGTRPIRVGPGPSLAARGRTVAACCFFSLLAVAAAAQNLLANPDFNLTAASWVDCDDDSEPAWLVTDERDCEGSGSARASACPTPEDGILVGQCLDLPPTPQVFLAARLRAASGVVVLVLNFCQQSSCAGGCEGFSLVATDDGDGQWQSVSGHKNVPPGTQSLYFIAGATPGATDVEVDATYLGLATLLFRDDFEGDGNSDTPCRWGAQPP